MVREAGDGAAVSAGDRVLLCPNETCGACEYCREGPETLCEQFMLYHGALAEQALVEADRLVPLPGEVGFREAAALLTACLTAWRMLKVADVGPTDLVFVPGDVEVPMASAPSTSASWTAATPTPPVAPGTNTRSVGPTSATFSIRQAVR